MIIDAHSHWLPEKIINNAHFFSKAWGDIEAQIKKMDEAGIDRAVLSYPTSDAHLKLGGTEKLAQTFNDNVAEIIKKFPDRFIGAAVLPIGDSGAMQDELKRSTEELGFKAISLASSYDGKYLDEEMFLPIYKEAEKNNIPIFVHSQIINPIGAERVKDPLLTPVIEYIFDLTICAGRLLMSDILRSRPNLKFIFAYFAGATAHLAARFDTTYQMLRGINFVKDLGGLPSQFLKNIYVDTSGDTKLANFIAALELVGPKNILWGSDWPAKKDIGISIKAVRDLDLSQEEKKGILGTNLENILKGN